nr:cag pathogenicity island protein [Helicobacter cetorum]
MTLRKTPKRELKGTLISYLSIKKTNLKPLKENLRYTTNQEFLSCSLDMTNSYVCNLPHIATMGRDKILP